MRICENGVYRDATTAEVFALEQVQEEVPDEMTMEERLTALEKLVAQREVTV